ncbi:MAG: hypothetical protein J6D03_06985 [Clostridia bacterium]|nr:hypothetical protein [Clostridia bacterium]
MINLKDYIDQQINEEKQPIYNSSNIKVYGGDHFIDRKFDRNIDRNIIAKTIKGFERKILKAIEDNNFSENKEVVLINKNTKPYLNIPLHYVGYKNNIHIIVIKTIMYKMNYKTFSYTIIGYV